MAAGLYSVCCAVPGDLRRVRYESPPIVTVVAQVVLSWSLDQMSETVAGLVEPARGEFAEAEPLVENTITLSASPIGMSRSTTSTPAGLRCVGESKVETLVEGPGVRGVHPGPYGPDGRRELFAGIEWWLSAIEERLPDVRATRASVLVHNVIAPETGADGGYQVSDFFRVRFTFDDDDLSEYVEYDHTVVLDLGKFARVPMRGRLRMATGPVPPGVVLQIDVLDDRVTPLRECMDRLSLVKDVETHVFERCITDRTREIYGPYEA